MPAVTNRAVQSAHFPKPKNFLIGIMCVCTIWLLNLLSTGSLVSFVLVLISHSVFLSLVSLSYLSHMDTTQAQRWQMSGSPWAHYDPVHHRVTTHKTCGISSGKCCKQSLCPGSTHNRSPRLWCWCCEEPQDMPCGHEMTPKWQTLHLYWVQL